MGSSILIFSGHVQLVSEGMYFLVQMFLAKARGKLLLSEFYYKMCDLLRHGSDLMDLLWLLHDKRRLLVVGGCRGSGLLSPLKERLLKW